MAKRRSKATKPTRSAKSARTARPAAEVEVVEEKSGMGWEGGVAIVTTLLLIVAWMLVDKQLGIYGAGVFFK